MRSKRLAEWDPSVAEAGPGGDAEMTSDLREIERMMTAFASELKKLDETLEVLSAYVRRMRTSSDPRAGRVLH